MLTVMKVVKLQYFLSYLGSHDVDPPLIQYLLCVQTGPSGVSQISPTHLKLQVHCGAGCHSGRHDHAGVHPSPPLSSQQHSGVRWMPFAKALMVTLH